jgi:hypothetical protein
MDKIEQLIKGYLKDNLSFVKSLDCPDEQTLLEYLDGDCQNLETHIVSCGFCLSQLNIAFESKTVNCDPVPQELTNKTKSSLGISKKSKSKKKFFLAGAIISFILSFLIPRYFMQCLVVTLILGIRWAFESEGGRTLIMVLDSWRHHSQAKDDEISHRLRK